MGTDCTKHIKVNLRKVYMNRLMPCSGDVCDGLSATVQVKVGVRGDVARGEHASLPLRPLKSAPTKRLRAHKRSGCDGSLVEEDSCGGCLLLFFFYFFYGV